MSSYRLMSFRQTNNRKKHCQYFDINETKAIEGSVNLPVMAVQSLMSGWM